MIRRAVLALGSNLGDSLKCFNWAILELDKNPDILLVSCSQFRWTKPESNNKQPNYLNGAILLHTTLSAHELLKIMLDLENKAGRDRETEKKGDSRVLDLDLIWMEGVISSDSVLTLPHPRASQRDFVMKPSIEIFPEITSFIST